MARLLTRLLVLLGAWCLASAAPKVLPNCQVCLNVETRNSTTQGALNLAGCNSFVDQYINTVFLAQYSKADSINFVCSAGQRPGTTIKACSNVPEQAGVPDLLSSVQNKAAFLYEKILEEVCPSTAKDLDYLRLIVETVGDGCESATSIRLSYRYCAETRLSYKIPATAAVAFPQQSPALASEASGPVIQNSPAGQGYCWICFFYWMPFSPFDYYNTFRNLNDDLTNIGQLYLWNYRYQPRDRKIDYVFQQEFNFPPYGTAFCTSSTFYWTSPSTGVNYDFTSDYLAMVQANNDFFVRKYGLGCKSKGNPLNGAITQNSLYYTVAPLDMDKYGGMYPVSDARGVHRCSPPGSSGDGGITMLGMDC